MAVVGPDPEPVRACLKTYLHVVYFAKNSAFRGNLHLHHNSPKRLLPANLLSPPACLTLCSPQGSAFEAIGQWTTLLSLPVYTSEALLRMYGTGLFRNSQSYFRDPWSIFDFLVVVASFVDLAVTNVIPLL